MGNRVSTVAGREIEAVEQQGEWSMSRNMLNGAQVIVDYLLARHQDDLGAP
jgi:hypothetical protein